VFRLDRFVLVLDRRDERDTDRDRLVELRTLEDIFFFRPPSTERTAPMPSLISCELAGVLWAVP